MEINVAPYQKPTQPQIQQLRDDSGNTVSNQIKPESSSITVKSKNENQRITSEPEWGSPQIHVPSEQMQPDKNKTILIFLGILGLCCVFAVLFFVVTGGFLESNNDYSEYLLTSDLDDSVCSIVGDWTLQVDAGGDPKGTVYSFYLDGTFLGLSPAGDIRTEGEYRQIGHTIYWRSASLKLSKDCNTMVVEVNDNIKLTRN